MRLIKRHGIDIVHTHGKGPGLYGRLAAAALGVPAVHTFHGIHYSGYSRAGRRLYLGLERQLSRMSQVIINVSASQEAEGLGLGLFAPRAERRRGERHRPGRDGPRHRASPPSGARRWASAPTTS